MCPVKRIPLQTNENIALSSLSNPLRQKQRKSIDLPTRRARLAKKTNTHTHTHQACRSRSARVFRGAASSAWCRSGLWPWTRRARSRRSASPGSWHPQGGGIHWKAEASTERRRHPLEMELQRSPPSPHSMFKGVGIHRNPSTTQFMLRASKAETTRSGIWATGQTHKSIQTKSVYQSTGKLVSFGFPLIGPPINPQKKLVSLNFPSLKAKTPKSSVCHCPVIPL